MTRTPSRAERKLRSRSPKSRSPEVRTSPSLTSGLRDFGTSDFGTSDFTMSPRAEILSIGSELTSGQNLDTNSQWLSRRLAEMGIGVGWHTTIADDLAINVDAFRIA